MCCNHLESQCTCITGTHTHNTHNYVMRLNRKQKTERQCSMQNACNSMSKKQLNKIEKIIDEFKFNKLLAWFSSFADQMNNILLTTKSETRRNMRQSQLPRIMMGTERDPRSDFRHEILFLFRWRKFSIQSLVSVSWIVTVIVQWTISKKEKKMEQSSHRLNGKKRHF